MKQGDLFGEERPKPGAKPKRASAGRGEPAGALPARAKSAPERPAAPAAPASSGGGSAGSRRGCEARPEPADAAARRTAVTEFDRPLLLAAGAGTGKTATLVARVVHWCLGRGWEEARAAEPELGDEELAARVLRGVAAITFTEAAAAEMSARVSQALAKLQRLAGAGGGEGPPPGFLAEALPQDGAVLRERARALRAGLDNLAATTIHAFCRRLLSAHPLAVGFDPAFVVDASFSRAEVCVRDVIEELLRERWGEPVDPDLVALARAKVGPRELEQAVIALLDAGARAADFAEDPLDARACAALRAELEGALRAAVEAAAPLQGSGGNTELALEALARSLAALGEHPSASPEETRGLARALTAAWKDDKRCWKRVREEWSRDGANKGDSRRLGAGAGAFQGVIERLRQALEPYVEIDHDALQPVRRTLGEVIGRVEAELRRRGVATFNDLLVEARRLLVEDPAVAAAERRKLRLLLVDEFQDTDALQCEIVSALALEGPPAERPSLFLVGDPKQSIFAWRNADLAAFDDFAERVRAEGGRRLELSANFRSRPAVLEEVERALAPVMREERGVQPAFAALAAAREAGGGPASVEHWVSWPRDAETGALEPSVGRRKGASYEVEARAVAADVAARTPDGAGYERFAVLFRATTEAEPYLEALREHGIPYEVASERKYYQRREVVDATALVRALVDPHDQLALVTLLRSPFVGVPDAALLPLWEAGFPGKVAWLLRPDDEREAELAELVRAAARRVPAGEVPGLVELLDWEESLVAALSALARGRAAFGEQPADRWIDLVRGLFLSDAVESARFLGAYRLANLERFWRELQRALDEREGDVQSVVRTLRANLAREDRTESTRPSDSGRDAVKILTIHGAKGLEFDHVYLVQTHKEDGGDRDVQHALDRRASGPGEAAAWVAFGVPTPRWFRAKRQRREAEAAERVRLLYVALTRAAERLVVVGAWPVEAEGKPLDKAKTMLDLLGHRAGAGEAVRELARRARDGDLEPWTAPDGSLWRLAASLAPEEPAQRRERGPLAGSDEHAVATAQEIERESLALAADRERARARAARPFSRAASAEAHADGAEARALARFGDGADAAPAGDPTGDPAGDPAGDDGGDDGELEGGATGAPHAADASAPGGPKIRRASRALGSMGGRDPLPAIGRAAAQAAGTAVHRALELLDLTGDRADELARAGEALGSCVRALAPADAQEAALERARALLARAEEHGLVARLFELGEHVLARELPVLLPASDDAGEDPTAPVGFVSGAIDLLYRDPATGEPVVADYKTDVVDDEEALAERVRLYAPQGRAYVEAVREALGLERPPRFELWFLAAGRVERA